MTDRKGDGMLERMARAIAGSDGYSADELDRMAGDPRLDPMPEYRINARAALMAMRVPDTEIAEVGMIAGGFTGYADVAWTAMIDAILADSGPHIATRPVTR